MAKADQTIEHARVGLENTQRIIAFIDKKVGAGIAIVSVILGFVYPKKLVGAFLIASCDRIMLVDWYAVGIVLLTMTTCVFLLLALLYAYKTIFPRPPDRLGKWVLLPFSDGADDNDRLFKSLGDKFSDGGMAYAEILSEYRDQLTILGDIQCKKMRNCKWMFRCLGLFVVGLITLAAMALCA